MRVHSFGENNVPIIIMLPGSFCNADTMDNIIRKMETEFHVLAVDYNGQYKGSEKPFTSRQEEAEEIVRYLEDNGIDSIDLVYVQSMGAEIGMELIHQLERKGIPVKAAFFDGGPFMRFPKFVSKMLGNKFKKIIGNLRGKTLEEVLTAPTLVKFSGGKPERYKGLLGPICQNAEYISDETLEREADACVTFDYPQIKADLTLFYSKEESAYRFCHRKIEKTYPDSKIKLVSGYGHVGYPADHLDEYCSFLKAAAAGQKI